jgi:penicillin amidase
MDTNYIQELLFVQARDKLTGDEWDMLFPPYPGMEHPADEYYPHRIEFEIAPFLPAARAFYESFFGAGGSEGSNNWAVVDGPGGRPCLANDTHMSLMVPNIWYICHLEAPGMHVAGFSIPGSPGVFIGHNGKVAWGFTNLLQDAQDLYILETDPENPCQYRVGDRWYTMQEKRITIEVSDAEEESFTAYYTKFGPVITEVSNDYEAVVALKWYGTLSDEALKDQSTKAFFDLARAESVDKALEAAIGFKYLGQHMIVAGKEGRIGYHAFGAVPTRSGYSGRFPALGSEGTMNWTGFIPYDELPHSIDPAEERLVTANNPVIEGKGESGNKAPISFSWSEPYRVRRISERLEQLNKPTVADFSSIQMDIQSGAAGRVLDRILAYPSDDPLAAEAREYLREWDRTMHYSSLGALIFEVFLLEWIELLIGDELGEEFQAYMSAWPSINSIEDVILDYPDSALWDRKDTEKIETPAEILDMALARSMQLLTERLGEDRTTWQWGRLHTVTFRHPAGTGLIGKSIFNRGPFPAHGSLTTVNVGGYMPAATGLNFDVAGIPNMRMVVPLDNPDRTVVISPPGQSGVPFHRHYDDMIEPWREGINIPLPFSREAVDAAAVAELRLYPAKERP